MKKSESSSCLEEPLISKSSSLGSNNLEVALRNFYRMRNLVIILGLISLLFTILFYPTNYPTVKKIHLFFAISLQTMSVLTPLSSYMVARNMDSSGDQRVNTWRKCSMFWCVFGIFCCMYCIRKILNSYDPDPSPRHPFSEKMRLIYMYCLMGGSLQWIGLYCSNRSTRIGAPR